MSFTSSTYNFATKEFISVAEKFHNIKRVYFGQETNASINLESLGAKKKDLTIVIRNKNNDTKIPYISYPVELLGEVHVNSINHGSKDFAGVMYIPKLGKTYKFINVEPGVLRLQ